MPCFPQTSCPKGKVCQVFQKRCSIGAGVNKFEKTRKYTENFVKTRTIQNCKKLPDFLFMSNVSISRKKPSNFPVKIRRAIVNCWRRACRFVCCWSLSRRRRESNRRRWESGVFWSFDSVFKSKSSSSDRSCCWFFLQSLKRNWLISQ